MTALERTSVDTAIVPWMAAVGKFNTLARVTDPNSFTPRDLHEFLHTQLSCFEARQDLISATETLRVALSGVITPRARARTQTMLQYLNNRRDAHAIRQYEDQGYVDQIWTSLLHILKASPRTLLLSPVPPTPAIGQPAQLQGWLDQQSALWSTRQQSRLQVDHVLFDLQQAATSGGAMYLEQYLDMFVTAASASMTTFENALIALLASMSADITLRDTTVQQGQRDVSAMADVAALATYVGQVNDLIDAYEKPRAVTNVLVSMYTQEHDDLMRVEGVREAQALQDAMTQYDTACAQLVIRRDDLTLILGEARREGAIPSLNVNDNGTAQDAQDATTSGLAVNWLGPLHLGSGAHGVANVWVKQGPNSRVIDVSITCLGTSAQIRLTIFPASGDQRQSEWQPQ